MEVPFDVPLGVRRIHVEYDYSARNPSDQRLEEGNTLDIGLLDPVEFRGWSGSHKRAFTVTDTWATPSYLAGPLPAGTWHVLLGPYKVVPAGCEYEVRIGFNAEPGSAPQRPHHVAARRAKHTPPAKSGWLRGDLHCHTLHSDGDSWPEDMLAHAVQRGLDFLGVTDHNTTTHLADYAQAHGTDLPIVLPGIEVTTYRGHWNAWSIQRSYEFREPTSDAVSRAMLDATADGALVSINHPKPFGPAWEYGQLTGYHAIEVWNGPFEDANDVALKFWDDHLRAGRRVVALGGSDTHELKTSSRWRLGVPTTWAQVNGEPSPQAVLDALRAGRVFVSRDVNGPQLYVSCVDEAYRVRAVGARGATLRSISDRGAEREHRVATDDWTLSIEPAQAARYLRAELLAPSGEMLALSNAVSRSGRR